MRLVTFDPSRPASGLSLTEKRIASVGGSIGWAAIGSVTAGSAMVFDTVAFSRPAMAMMSPACALSTGTRSSPSKLISLVARPTSTTLPSASRARIGSLILTVPDWTRPVRTRPMKLSRSSRVARKLNGPSVSRPGAGT